MSEKSGDLTASGENNRVGPDYFGFYSKEIVELLAEDADLMPFPKKVSVAGTYPEESGEQAINTNSCGTKEKNGSPGSASLYSNGIGALLSEFKKERLKSLLRQSAFTLTQEIDEVIDSTCRMKSLLRRKECLSSSDASECKDVEPKHRQKKLKALPSSLDPDSEHTHTTVPEKDSSDGSWKKCSQCLATRTPQWRHSSDKSQFLCNACGLKSAKTLKNGSIRNSHSEAGKENTEAEDDLQILLQSDPTKVEELIKSHSGELRTTLQYMGKKLEEILDNAMTSCRPMTLAEKQHLRKMIQNLPPENLDRVVGILGRNKPSGKYPSDEVHVDLDGEDNVTLWRLYFYIKAAQS